MKRDKMKEIQHLAIAFVATCFTFCSISMAKAETFCVQTSSALQSALTTAANNGEADEIRIVQGTYTGNFTYETQEAYKLTVKGGYASGCASRVVNASNTVLDGNSAGTVLMVNSEGGADFECEGVTFQNGSAVRGGGLRIDSQTGNVTLSKNMVSGNRATEFGGGINISSNGTITLTDNTISNNESDYYAAAASIHGGGAGEGTLVLTANTIKGNTADGAVGGLSTGCGSVSLTNNLFYNNSASWYYGAILIDGSNSTRVINNTISGNYAEGRGAGFTIQLDDDSDRADIYNNIIYNNTGHWEANDLCILNDQDENGVASPVSLLNNDFDQSSTGTYIEIPFTIDPSNLNNQDPLFVGSSTGDYHLAKGSPCIDTGTSTDAPVTDIAGTSRPQGQGYDMGAYEYVGIPVPLPNSQEFFTYPPSASPVMSSELSSAKPIGVGSIATGGEYVSLRISTGKFSGAVDIYFGIYMPAIDPSGIYILTSDYGLRRLSEVGLVPWKAGVNGPINEAIFGDIPTSDLPFGKYNLYLMAALPGNSDIYYLWSTYFEITEGDTSLPSVPTGLTATTQSSSQINLSWTASTDNVAVTGYKIYRDGTYLETVTATSTSDTGLNSSTQYCYTVSAFDSAGNNSAQSSQACVTTDQEGDTSPPSVPTGLTATTQSSSQINLSWTASTDNVAVTGYKIYRDGTYLKTYLYHL